MKKYINRGTISIFLIYFVLAASTGVYFPFNALYLTKTLAFDASQLSLIDGIAQFSAMLFLPIVGMIGDRIRKTNYLLIVMMIISSIMMFIYSQVVSFSVVLLVFSAFLIFRRTVFPLLDSIALQHCKNNKLNFGSFRLVYTFTYMVCAVLMGILFDDKTTITKDFIYISIAFNILVAVVAIMLPQYHTKQKESNQYHFKNLILNKKFIQVSIIVSLGMASVSIVSMYNSALINEFGGQISDVGYATIMQMLPEVLLSIFVIKKANKVGHLKVINLGLIILLFRWLIICLFTTYPVFYFSTIIEGTSTILILIVGLDYLKEIIEPKYMTSATTTYTSLTLFVYAILVNVSGVVKTNLGLLPFFMMMFITVAIALVYSISTNWREIKE
ncbi:MAG: MFS transporter [Erysipelotrichales bacterium]